MCLRPPQNVKIRHFQVVVVQRRQRDVRTNVMHMQSYCFAYLNLLKFPVLDAVAVVRRVALSSLKNPDTETVLFGNRFPGERAQIGIKICVFENAWICVDIASVLI